MSISPSQASAAQALLGLKQIDVAKAIGATRQNLSQFQRLGTSLSGKKVEALKKYFEELGVEFLEHDGVRRKPSGAIRTLKGNEGFKEFIYDVYNTVRDSGGHICVSNVDEKQFERWQGTHAKDYLSKMASVRDLTFQILVREGDDYHTASKYAQYRYLPVEFFSGVPTYIYGDKKAEILFGDDTVTVFLFENKQMADAQRRQFKLLWEAALA